MANRYRKGANYEREIVKKEREKGRIAFRSAGSKSPIDVCIIDPTTKKIKFVQAKSGKSYREAELERIEREISKFDGTYSVKFELWQKEIIAQGRQTESSE